MFTGIIQAVGRLESMEPQGGDLRVWISAADLPLTRVALGDSIAVDGVCLTVAELDGAMFAADVSRETLELTTLGNRQQGAAVNLEPALTLNQPLGGHLVSGHVDGVGEVTACHEDARSLRMRFAVPGSLLRYIARKGSITVNGVSLTVNRVEARAFDVNLVPHTLQATNLGELKPGAAVNIEVDLVARYLEQLLLGGSVSKEPPLLLAGLANQLLDQARET